MAIYRIYLVHPDGTQEPNEAFYCAQDHEAVGRFAPPARADVRAELWQGGRLIAVAGTARRAHDEAGRRA